jgi:2-hydroxy-6-oxonona-2,4-dienedioate hydrolase
MASQAIAAAPADARILRYRDAERAYWSHYGLQPTERSVELDTLRMRVRVQELGAGDPVLFISGSAGTGPTWAPLVRELPSFRSLMVDRPGWGLTTAVDYTKHEYRSLIDRILTGVLDAFALPRVNVVGASIGNLWALTLARHEPDRVGRVVLLGGGPILPSPPPPTFIRLLASPIGAVIARAPQKPDRVRTILRGLGHGRSLDAGLIPDAFVDWRVSFERELGVMRQERNMVRALTHGATFRPGVTLDEASLGAIDNPTLMVYGTEDPVGSVDSWRATMGLLPHGSLHVVQGAGHVPWFDDAAGVGDAVRKFLNR